MSQSAPKQRLFPALLTVAAVAFAAFFTGFAFQGESGDEAAVQVSRMRSKNLDIYTEQALKREFADASSSR